MAITLTTTVGGASSDSYATTAEAETYFLKRLGAEAWNASTATYGSDAKEQALLAAMTFLESLNYLGSRASTTQALEWPRSGNGRNRWLDTATTGLVDLRGRAWASTVIPTPIKRAQYEMALSILQSPHVLEHGLSDGAELWAGALRINLKTQNEGATAIPHTVLRELSGLVISGVRLVKC